MRLRFLLLLTCFVLFSLLAPLPVQGGAPRETAQPVILGEQSTSPAACHNVDYPPVSDEPQLFDRAIDHFVTPPNTEGPTIVELGVFVLSLTNIDSVTDTFTVEGFLDQTWCDPRLAFDPLDFGWHEKFFLEGQADAVLSEIWHPDITFPNQEHSRDREALEILIFDDGTVEYRERFSVVLQAEFDLRRFPLDAQRLVIEIESQAWSEQYLQFEGEEDLIGFSESFEIPEWQIVRVEHHLEDVQESRDRYPFSEFLLDIEVQRQPGFYLWKVIVPVLVIMMLSWSVFLMSDNTLSERLGVSFTGILTVVAYQFVVADMLPRVPYLTLLDALLTLSFVTMALTIVQNLTVHILKAVGRETAGLRVDQLSCGLFPVLYVLGVAVLYVVFFGAA